MSSWRCKSVVPSAAQRCSQQQPAGGRSCAWGCLPSLVAVMAGDQLRRGLAVARSLLERAEAEGPKRNKEMLTQSITLALCLITLSTFAPDLYAAGSSSLADATERLDRPGVRALLKQQADVNAPQADGMTALHWAAYHDDQDIAALLLRAGANAKAANRYGVTPLSLACTNGSAAMVGLLLNAGADPNGSLPGGETPLMTAARTGSLESVKALLSRGAAVDAKDENRGQTALMWAAAEGHAAVAQELIAAKADFRTRLPSGFTPLMFAVREGRLPVVRVLVEAGADVNETIPVDGAKRRGYGGRLPAAGTSALLLAVMNAHFELAAELLDAGANPNVDLTGYTVLHAI